jgi:nucleotidyltransferase/DNA polymerase involved in DNA repair
MSSIQTRRVGKMQGPLLFKQKVHIVSTTVHGRSLRANYTDWPQLVEEVRADFCAQRVSRGQRGGFSFPFKYLWFCSQEF